MPPAHCPIARLFPCPFGRPGLRTKKYTSREFGLNSCNLSHLKELREPRTRQVPLSLLSIKPARAPILRYGVAGLSTTLALIPALLLPNIAESRLAVFAVD